MAVPSPNKMCCNFLRQCQKRWERHMHTGVIQASADGDKGGNTEAGGDQIALLSTHRSLPGGSALRAAWKTHNAHIKVSIRKTGWRYWEGHSATHSGPVRSGPYRHIHSGTKHNGNKRSLPHYFTSTSVTTSVTCAQIIDPRLSLFRIQPLSFFPSLSTAPPLTSR